MAENEKTDLFQFVALRAPQNVAGKKLRHGYFSDDQFVFTKFGEESNENGEVEEIGKFFRKPRNIFSIDSASLVGRTVYKYVFCSQGTNNTPDQISNQIALELMGYFPFRSPRCVVNPGEEGGSVSPDTLVDDLDANSYYWDGLHYFIIPEKLETIMSEEWSFQQIIDARKVLTNAQKAYDREAVFSKLIKIFGKVFEKEDLLKVVYTADGTVGAGYADPPFGPLRRQLFERLYRLYIARRLTTVNLEDTISGLQTMHAIEYIAIDHLLHRIYKGTSVADAVSDDLLKFIKDIHPELAAIKLKANPAKPFYFIKNEQDLSFFLSATPIIPPIVAELGYYGKGKFNTIKPFLGDLKVVKQWLLGYKAGEISHIHNIMAGEEKVRDHRHLEKTEDRFSFSSENTQSVQSENQTTDRFELKREADRVIKTDINLGANTNFTYNGSTVTATVGANFSFANSVQDTQKVSSNFAQDVLKKAVTNIQSRTTEERSITKLFETEEKNNHKFTNTAKDANHISGIYRWLDKKYQAQVYNFGKRWMFEFIIPEPAAFFVMSKLKAVEFDMELPIRPDKPILEKIVLPEVTDMGATSGKSVLRADLIDKSNFNLLKLEYDLDDTYPRESFWFPFTDKQKGDNNLFVDVYTKGGDQKWTNSRFRSIVPEGYDVDQINFVGMVWYFGIGEAGIPNGEHWESNKLLFKLNGNQIKEDTFDKTGPNITERREFKEIVPVNPPISCQNNEAILDLNFQDLREFTLSCSLHLKINGDFLLNFQSKVFNKIKLIEQAKVDKLNQEIELTYKAALSEYHNRLDELKAKTVNDLLQGRSEAFNAQLIKEELKRHCISMIAKEFDINRLDDVLSRQDAMPMEPVGDPNSTDPTQHATTIEYLRFRAGEEKVGQAPNETLQPYARFETKTQNVQFPRIDIDKAKEKGRYVQFLEQAFEWHHIAYMFYPYFWAHESKWVKMMNRLDYVDNNLTEFLKAGSARVLIAVTPGYYNAVMHFLATRQPWDGGPAPVLGDPLYLPLYEEIHNQQDNLRGATPEGEPWPFELPTSLVYLQDSSSPIPEDLKEKPPKTN